MVRFALQRVQPRRCDGRNPLPHSPSNTSRPHPHHLPPLSLRHTKQGCPLPLAIPNGVAYLATDPSESVAIKLFLARGPEGCIYKDCFEYRSIRSLFQETGVEREALTVLSSSTAVSTVAARRSRLPAFPCRGRLCTKIGVVHTTITRVIRMLQTTQLHRLASGGGCDSGTGRASGGAAMSTTECDGFSGSVGTFRYE